MKCECCGNEYSENYYYIRNKVQCEDCTNEWYQKYIRYRFRTLKSRGKTSQQNYDVVIREAEQILAESKKEREK